MSRVVIVVNGGVVTSVYSDDGSIGAYRHYLILEDNIEDMEELEIN